MRSAHRDEAAYIIGNDVADATAMERLFSSINIEPHIFHSPIDFLRSFAPDKPCCLVMEMRMPKLTGLELLTQLQQRGSRVPAIIVTAFGEVTSAVRAIKLGAVEFMEKPVNEELLVECAQHWIGVYSTELAELKRRATIEAKLAKLSPREREVLQGLLDGKSNKEIARERGVTPKAIELYRSKLMSKMETSSLAELIRDTLCYSAVATNKCRALNERDEARFRLTVNTPDNMHDTCVQLIDSSQYLCKRCGK